MSKILIVDDALADRALVAGLLNRSMECTVLEAPDGKEALSMIELHQPDLVLTDLHMPEMNGRHMSTEALRHMSTVSSCFWGALQAEIRARLLVR